MYTLLWIYFAVQVFLRIELFIFAKKELVIYNWIWGGSNFIFDPSGGGELILAFTSIGNFEFSRGSDKISSTTGLSHNFSRAKQK